MICMQGEKPVLQTLKSVSRPTLIQEGLSSSRSGPYCRLCKSTGIQFKGELMHVGEVLGAECCLTASCASLKVIE